MIGRVGRGLGAALALVGVVVGTPLALVQLVGNPWPGRERVRLGDELAVVVGVLAVLGWLVWARFVVAVIAEVRIQLDERRHFASDPPAASGLVRFDPPPVRTGAGRLAQRLVAAILVLVPAGARVAPSTATATVAMTPAPVATAPARSPAATPTTPVHGETSESSSERTMRLGETSESSSERTTRLVPAAPAPVRTVTVVAGDTLIGIARSELGDGGRWREIFDANRDTVQPDGARLTSPSLIRVGWTLLVPAAPSRAPAAAPTPAAASYLAPDVVTVVAGDSLWDLAHDRLAAAGLPHDEVAVADYVHAVVVGNPEGIEDPDLIFAGERFAFPSAGSPPRPSTPVEAVPTSVPAPTLTPDETVPATRLEEQEEASRSVEAPAPLRPGVAAETPTASAPAAATPGPATSTTTTTTSPEPAPREPARDVEDAPGDAPSPIGLGEVALLSAGVVALVAARRRQRLRSSMPRARVPDPDPDAIDAERRLRSVDAGERVLRVDVAVRAAAASLVHGPAQIAVVRAGPDGLVELRLTAPSDLPPPWERHGDVWRLSGATPIELLAEAARAVGAPCVALAQLGVDDAGCDVLVDLEALGVLAIDAPPELADAVVNGIAATLASSIFAEVAHLVGVGVDAGSLLGHRHAHSLDAVDDALELAATVVGATAAARQSTFVRRARHTSGEAWEPAVVLVGAALAGDVSADVVRSAARVGGGLAVVAGAAVPGAPWTLRVTGASWVLEPLGTAVVPVGLTDRDVAALHAVIAAADAPLIVDEACERTVPVTPAGGDESSAPPAWSLLVRLLGPVEIVDVEGRPAQFERSKALELVAWLSMHRDRATRGGARTALWELDVRDATFANVVSEARRAMARLVEPPVGEEWLGRTLTEVLPLHAGVCADVDLVRHALDVARMQPPELAIETLRPAVELVRDAPFAGTGYLWPDAEGITSNLVLLATSVATELAGHFLSVGDIDGVFWATDRGLRVLSGHEGLIALRMRAHARAGDLAGVRREWESYERVLTADPWSDGEPAAKLVLLRRELLA